jgi:hypothetical protein
MGVGMGIKELNGRKKYGNSSRTKRAYGVGSISTAKDMKKLQYSSIET